jgi:hypothetical protein
MSVVDESPLMQHPTQPGTTGDAGAMVPPLPPGPAPSAFHMPCPACGTVVEFPFDPVRSAILDELVDINESLKDLLCAREEVEA